MDSETGVIGTDGVVLDVELLGVTSFVTGVVDIVLVLV